MEANELTFAQLFRSHPLPMWMFDRATLAFVEVNDAAVVQYGYSREEFLAMTIEQIRPETERTRLAEYLAQLRPPMRKSGIWVHRRKDGSTFLADITSHTVEDRERDLVLVMATDVTERLDAEARVRQVLERFERAERHANIGSWSVRSDGAIALSKQAKRAFGLDPEGPDPSLDEFIEHIHPEDREHEIKCFDALLQGVVLPRTVFRTNPEFGEMRYLTANAYPYRDSREEIVGFEGTIEDVSETRRIEQLVHLQAEALSSAANAILIASAEGIIEWVNPAFTLLTGYDYEEAVGASTRLLNSGAQPPEFFAAMWATLLAGEVWRGELINRRKDGSHYRERQTITPVRDDFGRVTHFVAIKEDVTLANSALVSLKESEERFRMLAESTAMSILVIRNGRMTYVNRAFCALTGREASDLLGRRLESVVHPDDRVAARYFGMTDRSPQESALLSLRILRPGGESRVADFTTARINWCGAPAALGTASDVTARVQAEAELKDNQAFLRLIIESNPNCIKVLDPAGRLVDMNAAGLAMIEADSLREVKGRRMRDLVHPDYRSTFDALHRRVIQGERGEAAFEVVGLKGGQRSFETHGVPLIAAEGAVTGHLAVTRDVTEQNRLLVLNAQMTLVLEGVARGIPLKDTMNHLARAIEQYEPTTKATLLRVLPDGSVRHLAAPSMPEGYVKAVDGEKIGPRAGSCGTAAYENRLVVVEDTLTDPLWSDYRGLAETFGILACWSKPILGREGEVVGVVGLYYGTSRAPRQDELDLIETMAHIAGIAIQRHLSEQALRDANNALEQRVAERTTELLQAVQELEAFTYSVSHDLNAPLRVVAGFAQMLLEDHGHQLPEDGRKLVEVIVKRTRNMGELIRDLLTLSRATTADLALVPVDMTQLVHSALAQLLESGTNNVHIDVQTLPKAWGDPLLLKQVWLNLLTNAVKFSSRVDSPRIEVGAMEEEGEQVYWVADNGAGFDPQYQDLLFKVFWRGHTQSEFEGNGAGLAIVERIVRRHGGRVWAEGRPGEGATFWFSLPKHGQ
jgi:PAS domain S-box-containing protein